MKRAIAWMTERIAVTRERIAPYAKPLTVAALIFFATYTLYWYWHIPSIGKAVGMLGAVAAVMALRGEIHGSEKVLWMILIFGLLFIEVRAIDKDADDRKNERIAANKEFDRIADGLREVIEQNQHASERNQREFDASMRKTDAVLRSSQETLAQTTGAKSHCFVRPIMPAFQTTGPITKASMEVVNPTNYPLYDVSVEIGSMTMPVGVLGPHMSRFVLNGFTFSNDADNRISIQIISRTTVFIEQIVVSWNKDKWNEDYELRRVWPPSSKPIHEIAKDFPYIKKVPN